MADRLGTTADRVTPIAALCAILATMVAVVFVAASCAGGPARRAVRARAHSRRARRRASAASSSWRAVPTSQARRRCPGGSVGPPRQALARCHAAGHRGARDRQRPACRDYQTRCPRPLHDRPAPRHVRAQASRFQTRTLAAVDHRRGRAGPVLASGRVHRGPVERVPAAEAHPGAKRAAKPDEGRRAAWARPCRAARVQSPASSVSAGPDTQRERRP